MTQTQTTLRQEWESLDTPVARVYDENGTNMANGQIRARRNPATGRVTDAPGEENLGYLYVDDVDGYQVVRSQDAVQLLRYGPNGEGMPD